MMTLPSGPRPSGVRTSRRTANVACTTRAIAHSSEATSASPPSAAAAWPATWWCGAHGHSAKARSRWPGCSSTSAPATVPDHDERAQAERGRPQQAGGGRIRALEREQMR